MSSVDHVNENESAATPAEQITADGSVGSDTDTGAPLKTDSANSDGINYQRHVRSNSVKKPTSFKAVSVTKNFLAKAGTPTPPIAKVNGETIATVNGAGSLGLAARPRLVAKSSGPKQSKSTFGTRDGAGPDPLQVWNRNRVTPQHPPKHLTDEELKQQYGIHLATRIQADGDAKEAKWADIDDDEDDWAPETIEWNDGTKINITQQESASLLAAKRAEEEAAIKREEEEKKKVKAAKAAAENKPTSSVGPNATVLKPRSAQPKPGSPLVLKTPTEKPTLVSKPASSTPAKSPWAPLPAIDKVPPVEINPPVQQPALRPQVNGIQSQASIQIAPPPALEIAADSFKRGGAESQKDTVGQLYNDKSGKYEPAGSGRRASVRKDGGYRAPSLLQRGGHVPDASAILEASRDPQDPNTLSDRRHSSTVSAESAQQGRRMSVTKGLDIGLDRRGSQHSQALQSPQTPGLSSAILDATSPQDARSQTAYKAGPNPNVVATSGDRDDVVIQKQLMREKRDEAIKRRKEQAEREEAEKQERIRKKLASLGPEPSVEKRDASKQDVPSVTIEKRPSDANIGQVDTAEEVTTPVEESRLAPESPSKMTKSPPKPPAPSATGEPQQYGMMKLHAPVAREPIQQVNETLVAERARHQASALNLGLGRNVQEIQPSARKSSDLQTAGRKPSAWAREQRDHLETETLHKMQTTVTSPPGFETRPQESIDRVSPSLNGSLTPNRPEHLFSRSPEMVGQRSIGDLKQQPWNESAREPKLFSTWNQPQLKDTQGSVWGVPNQSRVLSNGIFDRTVQRPHSRHQEQFSTPTLAPIGPPKHLQQPKNYRDSRSLHDVSPIDDFEDTQTVPNLPFSDQAAINRRDRQAHFGSEQKLPSPHYPVGSQLEPDRLTQRSQYQSRERNASAWQDFTQHISQKEAEDYRQAQLERDAQKAEEARTGISHRPQVQFNEKWAQIEVDEQGPGRRVANVVRSLTQPGLSNVLQPTEIRGPSFVHTTDLASSMPGAIGRSSRFFPTTTRLHPYQQSSAPFTPYHRQSDSPPPPDSIYHPAFTPEARAPVVRLPSFGLDEETTIPKVKLPPANATPVSTPRPSPAQISLRPMQQPLVNNQQWQERFNGLLGTKKMVYDISPELATAHMVDFSATKEPLDLPTPRIQAAVALPPLDGGLGVSSPDVASQDYQDEEALFEPEAGSMPETRIPRTTKSRTWQPDPQRWNPSRPHVPSLEAAVTSKDIITLPQFPGFPGENTLLVFVKVAGMTNSVSRPMRAPGLPDEKGSQVPHHGSNRQAFNSNSKQHNRPYKPRDAPRTWNDSSRPAHPAPSNKAAGNTHRNNFHRNSQGTPHHNNAVPPKHPRPRTSVAAT